MAKRRHSIRRVTAWSLFLSVALLLGAGMIHLPGRVNLDIYRPEIIALLEKNFYCKAEIGHVRGQLFPAPGFFVSQVTLVQPSKPPRLLASGSAQFTLSVRALLHRKLLFSTFRFLHPRFVAHHGIDRAGKSSWTVLTVFPSETGPRQQENFVRAVEVRGGSLEIWDHASQPPRHWAITAITGQLKMVTHQGAFTGAVQGMGHNSRVDVRYNQADDLPLEVRLNRVDLSLLQNLLPKACPPFVGLSDARVRAAWRPQLEIEAVISPLEMKPMKGIRWAAKASWVRQHLRLTLKSPHTPMAIAIDADFPKNRWKAYGTVTAYDPQLVRTLYDQSWLNRLAGGGTLSFSAESGPANGVNTWQWAAGGRGFRLSGSEFNLADWSARGDAHAMGVYVRGATAQGGAAEVVWEKTAESPDAKLAVNVASVTVRQLLGIFQLEATPTMIPPTGTNPYGYESWLVSHAGLEGVIRSTGTFDVENSDIDMAGMHIDLSGIFGLTGTRQAQIQGGVYYVPLADRIQDFTREEAPITGVGQAGFTLAFPLNVEWLRGLNGSIQVYTVNGTIKALKTFYRVMSVFNLSNYLRLHMPEVSAQGVNFLSLSGTLVLRNGLLTTDNLFLKSPNMNIAMDGAVDLLMHRVDYKVRIEVLRFLEDLLKKIPLVNRIFKKPNKIFLPLVVRVKGQLGNPEVF